MNAQRRTKREERRTGGLPAAFTLMELLVVIAIIAILLGMIVPAYFSIREKAKYTKAKVTVKNLETAFKAYLDQYRTWPGEFGAGAETKIDATVVSKLQPFYEFEATNASGAFLDPFTTSTDPYVEEPYRFQVDGNYDNKIDRSGQTIYRTVIVWSVGPDRAPNTPDDVKSWD